MPSSPTQKASRTTWVNGLPTIPTAANLAAEGIPPNPGPFFLGCTMLGKQMLRRHRSHVRQTRLCELRHPSKELAPQSSLMSEKGSSQASLARGNAATTRTAEVTISIALDSYRNLAIADM